ncbi:hypothetical protein HK105_206836 [Polyrhizophydium stewartii]|uniref:Uncharacterized protein n=1 Tax=Polyrhizophydium stewartii TaxID=2732419 RepID=A0ABR4N2C0_9FUNG
MQIATEGENPALSREQKLALYKARMAAAAPSRTRLPASKEQQQKQKQVSAKRAALSRTDTNAAAHAAGSGAGKAHAAAEWPAASKSMVASLELPETLNSASDDFLISFDTPDLSSDARLEDLQHQLVTESNNAERLKAEIDLRCKEVGDLHALVEQLQDTLQKSSWERLAMIDAEEQLRAEAIELEKQTERIKTQWAQETTQLQSELQSKQQIVDELGQLIQELRDEIVALKSKPAAYADFWIHQVRVEELEATSREQAAQIEAANAKINEQSEELGNCFKIIGTLEDVQKKEQSDHAAEISKLKDTIFSLETTMYIQEKELTDKTTQIDELRAALDGALSENKSLYDQLRTREADLNAAEQTARDLQTEKASLENDNKGLHGELQEFETQFITQGVQLKKLHDDLADHEQLAEALGDTLRENEDLTREVHLLRNRRADGALGAVLLTANSGSQTDEVEASFAAASHVLAPAADIAGMDAQATEAAPTAAADMQSEASRDIAEDVEMSVAQTVCSTSSQTDVEFEKWERELKLLRFARHVIAQKLKEATASFMSTLREIEARNEVETSKWRETSTSQKDLIEKLMVGVTKTTQRVKELEAQLQAANEELKKLREQEQQESDEEVDDGDAADADDEAAAESNVSEDDLDEELVEDEEEPQGLADFDDDEDDDEDDGGDDGDDCDDGDGNA